MVSSLSLPLRSSSLVELRRKSSFDDSNIVRSQSYGPSATMVERGECLPITDEDKSPVRSSKGFMWLFVLFLGCVLGSVARKTAKGTAAQVLDLQVSKQQLSSYMEQLQTELTELERKIAVLSPTEDNKSEGAHKSPKVSNVRALHDMKVAQKRLDRSTHQSEILRQRIQNISLDAVLEKYGTETIYVKFTLAFPNEKKGPNSFVVEIFPAESLPYSVQTFLDMVSSGLLDGCSFIMNALHTLKASPLPYDGTSAKAKAQAFADAGLDSVAFSEYSDDFPHLTYTLGFAVDGSPNFFINTQDNTDLHRGEPCFAKVISGFDTLRRLEAVPTRQGVWLTQRVGIASVRIVEDKRLGRLKGRT